MDSKEGFTGNVYIYYGTEDIDFSKYSDSELRSSAEFILHNYEHVANLLPNNAKQAIFNNILSHFNYTFIFHKMFHMSRMYGGGIEVIDINKLPNSIWRTDVIYRNGIVSELPKIYGSGDFIGQHEATIENIVATLVVHEWYGHGMKHYFDSEHTHHLAYKSIINCKPLWDLTTDKYKGFVMDHFKYYYENETNTKLTDYYYLNLYNKYIKYYQDEK
ncbi:MAG: hypothetical protein K2I25_01040 [Muribaculaceae bacterium]|nr:hypothetical protein [Muribaculaceae bacterium]